MVRSYSVVPHIGGRRAQWPLSICRDKPASKIISWLLTAAWHPLKKLEVKLTPISVLLSWLLSDSMPWWWTLYWKEKSPDSDWATQERLFLGYSLLPPHEEPGCEMDSHGWILAVHVSFRPDYFGQDAFMIDFLDKLHLSSLSLLYRNNIDKGHAPWKNKQITSQPKLLWAPWNLPLPKMVWEWPPGPKGLGSLSFENIPRFGPEIGTLSTPGGPLGQIFSS